MFKRANKITSLLIAAASVMSLVPAYAADVKKVDSQDGTVYNAVAYKDGKFFVDGEINDNESDYYVTDGKFNALDDVDSGDDVKLFGEKYLDVSDGDYTVDLSSGTVTDDNTKSDTADDAAAALRKKAKNNTQDRYDKIQIDKIIDENTSDSEDLSKLNLVPGAKYAAPWYYARVTAADKVINATTGNHYNGLIAGGNTKFNIFTDKQGNYIDADYNLGKIKVTTTAAGVSGSKEDTIENTNDKYDAAGTANTGDDKLTASVVQGTNAVLTQDKDYIYRVVTITVKNNNGDITKINGVELSKADPAILSRVTTVDVSGNITSSTVTFKAVQKISKAQASGDVNNAKYAKNVTTYVVSDKDGKALKGKNFFDYSTWANTKFTVVNGKLIAYNYIDDSNSNKKVSVEAYSLKTSGGYYYLDEEDRSNEDTETSDKHGNAAVQTDVDGNLWRLDGGYIYKFDNKDDWDKVYKVDGAFDELEVYDKDNMAAWSEDDEVYSLIGGKKADDTKTTDQTTDTTTPVVITTGWVQDTNGNWNYINANGTKATGWVQDGSNWYYMNASGAMQTGWQYAGGLWYYLNPVSDGTRGAMKTGWINDRGTWYYLNPVSDGTRGAMKTGWINDNGTWYYCNSSGAMLANTTTPDGYYVGASGAWNR